MRKSAWLVELEVDVVSWTHPFTWRTRSLQYNQPDSEVYEHAQAVERAFERRYGELYPGAVVESQVET